MGRIDNVKLTIKRLKAFLNHGITQYGKSDKRKKLLDRINKINKKKDKERNLSIKDYG